MDKAITKSLSTINADSIYALYLLFPDDLENALLIIDQQLIKKFSPISGFAPPIFVYESGVSQYYITTQGCSCQAFLQKSLKGFQGMCKHLLASLVIMQFSLQIETIQSKERYTEKVNEMLRCPAETVEVEID